MMSLAIHPDGDRADLVVIGGDKRAYHYTAATAEEVETLQGGTAIPTGLWKSLTAGWMRAADGTWQLVLNGQGLTNEIYTARLVGTTWVGPVKGPVGQMIAPADNL